MLYRTVAGDCRKSDIMSREPRGAGQRDKELVGVRAIDRGRVQPAGDVQCVHGTDADAYGVPRAPGEVDLYVRQRMSLKCCSCANFCAAQLGRPLELCWEPMTDALATVWRVRL